MNKLEDAQLDLKEAKKRESALKSELIDYRLGLNEKHDKIDEVVKRA